MERDVTGPCLAAVVRSGSLLSESMAGCDRSAAGSLGSEGNVHCVQSLSCGRSWAAEDRRVGRTALGFSWPCVPSAGDLRGHGCCRCVPGLGARVGAFHPTGCEGRRWPPSGLGSGSQDRTRLREQVPEAPSTLPTSVTRGRDRSGKYGPALHVSLLAPHSPWGGPPFGPSEHGR